MSVHLTVAIRAIDVIYSHGTLKRDEALADGSRRYQWVERPGRSSLAGYCQDVTTGKWVNASMCAAAGVDMCAEWDDVRTPPGIRLHLCTTARSVNARRKTTITIQHRYPHARDPIRVQTGWAPCVRWPSLRYLGTLPTRGWHVLRLYKYGDGNRSCAENSAHECAAGQVVVLLASRTPTLLHLSICGRRAWRRQVQSRQPWLQQLRFAASSADHNPNANADLATDEYANYEPSANKCSNRLPTPVPSPRYLAKTPPHANSV